MKISKKTQRRTIILATAVALVALFHIAHFTVQLLYSTNPYIGIENHTFIGELDTPYLPYNIDDNKQDFAITIQSDEEGKPLVEARPASMIIFSKNPNYVRPDHFGWQANKAMAYAALVLFIVITVIVGWILIGAIKGFRTGNIFRKNHPALVRALALVTFFYYIILNNRAVFTQLATKELYGDLSPIELFGTVRFEAEVLTAPLLLLIFAELMAVAAHINEEESMTI